MRITEARAASARAETRQDLRARLAALVAHLRAHHRRAARWRRLGALDEATLADLGISRAQAQFEATRRFWKGPLNGG